MERRSSLQAPKEDSLRQLVLKDPDLRKIALMKKLAEKKVGAIMKIRTLDQLPKAQNTGLRIITGGMKTTPISEVERTAGLLSLEERREKKTLAPK